MKAVCATRESRRGAAIFTVLTIIFVVATVLASGMTFSLQRAYMARKLGDRVRAKAIAEAGVAKAYCMLATNWGLRLNPAAFPLTTGLGGTFDIGVQAVGDFAAVISCTGTYAEATEVAVLDVRLYDQSDAYGCVIFAKGEVTWSGCGTFSRGGHVHANSDFSLSGSGDLNADDHSSSTAIALSGNACWMRGNASAPAISDAKSHITGTKTAGAVPAVTLPAIDLTPYYNLALANAQIFTGKKIINSDTVVPGGIMWVNGDLEISGTINLTGCFIATGSIQIAGNGEHYRVGTYPAFVSRDSSISIPGSKNIRGLIYTRVGDIDISGGGSLEGQIICGNNFKKTGNSGVFAYTNCAPTEGMVAAMAWQK